MKNKIYVIIIFLLTLSSCILKDETNLPIIVKGKNLADKLEWLSENVKSNNTYIIETSGVEELNFNSKCNIYYEEKENVTIHIGSSDKKTVIEDKLLYKLQYPDYIFSIGEGVILILEKNITIKSNNNDNINIINVNKNGTLIMNGGNIKKSVLVKSGGTFVLNGGTVEGTVYIEPEGKFINNGGVLSGSSAAADYNISLSETETYTFPNAVYGYSTPYRKNITVTNTGNQATGQIDIKFTGANASSFSFLPASSEIKIPNLNPNDTYNFNLTYIYNLKAGTYTAAVKAEGENGISAGFDIYLTVDPQI